MSNTENFKKIAARDLEPGMFVVDLGLSWLDNPYLYSEEGLIGTKTTVANVQEEGFLEAYVDPSRSLVPIPEIDPNQVKKAKIDPSLLKPKVSLKEELVYAAEIYTKTIKTAQTLLDKCARQEAVGMKEVEPMIGGLMDSLLRNGSALMTLSKIQQSNDYLFSHMVNVAILAMYFGRFLGLHPVTLRRVGMAGLLADVGMLNIPTDIVNSHSKLSREDLALVQRHPITGYEMLSGEANIYSEVLDGVIDHHERYNGTGYPNGKVGNEISVVGRILALADCYNALTSDRPHRKAMAPHKAISVIYGMRGKDFDPAFLERFIQGVGVFPLGSAVELNTGQQGIVTQINPTSPIQPIISLVTDPRGKPVPERTVDLAGQQAIRIINCKESRELLSAASASLDFALGG